MELIKVETKVIGSGSVQAVNARDLHTFLENRDNFSTWIKERIDQYGFVENQDFVSFLGNTKKPKGGRPSVEYAITIDMAKELAMVERNEKGKQARLYFIECERKAKAAPSLPDFTNPVVAARAWADAEEGRLIAEKKVEEQKTAVEFHERYVKADNTKCLSDVSKILGIKPHSFNKTLNSDGILFKRDGAWLPYQIHIDAGYFEVNTFTNYGKIFNQTRVTARGITWLANKYGSSVSRAA